MSKYILAFSSGDASLPRAGGKGANLVRLVRAGFRVPPGFIITTDAYHAFVTMNQLQASIVGLAENASPEDSTRLENTSAEIRALFERGKIPADITAEIMSAYRDLCGQTAASENSKLGKASKQSPLATMPIAVAVRSSATAEDLPGLAFAGQQDTYLNIVGEEAVLDAVKKCWASLWTGRAMAYRVRNHIPPNEVALAVIVQQLVPAASSGILFTANPVTGRRDEMVIDASFGLGEAIVAGQVEPDHFVVNPHDLTITERKLGSKAIVILPRTGGGTEQIAQGNSARDDSQRQALPDGRIVELAQIARQVAEHFGSPQDIEWAWANQQLYLLQSRPITSLYPLPVPARSGLRVYVNFNFIQGVTDPLTPLGIDALRMLFSGMPRLLRLHSSMREILPDAGGRLFLDLSDVIGDTRLRNLTLNIVAQSDPAARQALLRLIEEGRIAPKRSLTARRALTLLIAFLPILRRTLTAWLVPERARRQVIARAEQFMIQTRAHARHTNDLASRLRSMENDLSHTEELGLGVMPTALSVFSAVQRMDHWLATWLKEKPGTALQLMRGLPNNATTEMDLKLWAAAQAIRRDPAALAAVCSESIDALVEAHRHSQLPAAAQRAIDEFLQAYGMRAVAEIDLGRPRWRDDPMPILQTLRSYLQIEDENLAPDVVFQRNREQAERLASDVVTRVRKTHWGAMRAKLIGVILRRMQVLSGLREAPLFYMVSMLDVYRTCLLDSARVLVTRGELERAEDIFFVPLETLERFAAGGSSASSRLDLKEIAAAHRLAYEQERMRKQIPRVLLSTGEAFYEGVSDSKATKDEVAGEAVSPGVVEGRVRVILDPRGAHLEPGEILVCPSTDPGWTPLFLTAGGLVMEIGGMVTHGSVVAREYGLPAVVGVHNATTLFKTGERVRVDGNRGRVSLLNGENRLR